MAMPEYPILYSHFYERSMTFYGYIGCLHRYTTHFKKQFSSEVICCGTYCATLQLAWARLNVPDDPPSARISRGQPMVLQLAGSSSKYCSKQRSIFLTMTPKRKQTRRPFPTMALCMHISLLLIMLWLANSASLHQLRSGCLYFSLGRMASKHYQI